uniref:DNA-directed RNA polymerase III subunit RPC6 n=1 Tax=Ditylenchus dipsaci TaxID=166011 RepID=A0A915DAR3_9BILA
MCAIRKCHFVIMTTIMTDQDTEAELEKKVIELLKSNAEGYGSDELSKLTPGFDGLLLSKIVNKLLTAGTIEMLKNSSGGLVLRLKRGVKLEKASPEEQLVFSLIEEADKMGIWIRDIRNRSGLTEKQLSKVLKGLEQQKLVKALKMVGTANKKTYILYNLEADESITGGTFYSDQQFDSQFVQALGQVCINFLQAKRREAENSMASSFLAQREASFIKSEQVLQYIIDCKVCKEDVNLNVNHVESILEIAVLDGKLEKRVDRAYRALKIRRRPTALATVPCLQCPMQFECRTGNQISPENCEYFKKYFDL